MDVPLDDLIRSNRSGRRGGRGGRRGGGGGGGSSASLSSSYSGHDDRSGGGAFRRARNSSQRNNPYKSNRRNSGGNSDDIWEHDRFEDEDDEEEEEFEVPTTHSRGTFNGSLETGSKIQITNLADSVNDSDIKELFEPFGDIKKSFVKFDKSGRSEGSATVVFARRASALEAIKKYNNVPLDNQAMKITLVNSAGVAGRIGGGGGGGGRMRSDDGGVRSFNKALRDASDLTIRVGGGRRGTQQGGRRVVVRRTVGGGGGRGGRGGRGRGRGGRSGGRQLYVRRSNF